MLLWKHLAIEWWKVERWSWDTFMVW